MTSLRILADDLTGALDCAAAFGAGVPVHLGQPAAVTPVEGIDIVATATRDVPPGELPALLAPSLAWLGGADLAFKKVDSLLRGNTFEEVAWLARAGGFEGVVFAPAFPAQGRVTEQGRQWVLRPGEAHMAARAGTIAESLPGAGSLWVPDVRSDAEMDAVAAQALQPGAPRRLWCGSAGLAHALARRLQRRGADAPAAPVAGPPMLVSASHHAVSREQWRVLRGSRWAAQCHAGADPDSLCRDPAGYPRLIDLSPEALITAEQAAALLARQAQRLAANAPRPGVLVVVGGDTLLALCRALGASGLRSEPALQRPGWGSARLVGGRWDGVVCHTRSGAFGGSLDLLEVLDGLAPAHTR